MSSLVSGSERSLAIQQRRSWPSAGIVSSDFHPNIREYNEHHRLLYSNHVSWVHVVALGAGMLTTLHVDTPTALWIVYQIVFALVIGFGF
jgi:hypothetical protein